MRALHGEMVLPSRPVILPSLRNNGLRHNARKPALDQSTRLANQRFGIKDNPAPPQRIRAAIHAPTADSLLLPTREPLRRFDAPSYRRTRLIPMVSRLHVHFSSGKDEWETPDDFFAELDATFHFDLDACASPHNAKCSRYFTKNDDALKQRWNGTVFLNPPYGRKIAAFIRKAYQESLLGSTVVCLVPSRTDTHWWHRYAMFGERFHLRGRLWFKGAKAPAPFPSAVVIFWSGRLGQAIRPDAQT